MDAITELGIWLIDQLASTTYIAGALWAVLWHKECLWEDSRRKKASGSCSETKYTGTVEGERLRCNQWRRGGVMKKQVLFSLLTTVLLMATGSAYAQLGGEQQLRFNVPFDYNVGNVIMKAGDYSVQRAGGTENALLIRGNGSSAFTLSGSVSGKAGSTTKLVFNKYGDQYFLAQVWMQGEETGAQLPRTSTENELMSKASRDSV